MITHRKPDYFTREFTLCMERVDKYYVLQSLRRDQGYYGAALFYQYEAARWHRRAIDARRQWQSAGRSDAFSCKYPECDGGYATGYCNNACRAVPRDFFLMPNTFKDYVVGEQG